MTRGSILLAVIFILFSCANKKNVTIGLLKPDKMQAVLWDIFRAEAYTSQYLISNPSRNGIIENARLQKQVFAIHQVSREDFYNSFSYYKTHAGMLKIMLDSIVNKAIRDKNNPLNIPFNRVTKTEPVK